MNYRLRLEMLEERCVPSSLGGVMLGHEAAAFPTAHSALMTSTSPIAAVERVPQVHAASPSASLRACRFATSPGDHAVRLRQQSGRDLRGYLRVLRLSLRFLGFHRGNRRLLRQLLRNLRLSLRQSDLLLLRGVLRVPGLSLRPLGFQCGTLRPSRLLLSVRSLPGVLARLL